MKFDDLPEYLQNALNGIPEDYVLSEFDKQEITPAIQRYAEEYAAKKANCKTISQSKKEQFLSTLEDHLRYMISKLDDAGVSEGVEIVSSWLSKYESMKTEIAASKSPWRPIAEIDYEPQYDYYLLIEKGTYVTGWFYDNKWISLSKQVINPTHFYDERILDLPKAGN